MKPGAVIALLMLIALVGVLIWHNARNAGDIDPHLLQAVKGNKALAKRLLEQAKFKYPGKSDRWYAEKVIYDLERDRAGGRGRYPSHNLNAREVRENIFLFTAVISAVNLLAYTISRWFRG